MNPLATRLVKAACLSTAILGATSMALSVAMPEPAFAAGGNGNGNGNGNGHGGGKGADRSDSRGNGAGSGNGGQSGSRGAEKGKAADRNTGTSFSKSGEASEKGGRSFGKESKQDRPVKSAKSSATKKSGGVHPSELGALNAANASANALAHASPNSRVGKIAAYRDAVLAGQALEADLDAALADLAGLTPPTRDVSEIEAERDAALADRAIAADNLDQLRRDLEEAGGTDAELEQSIADAEADLMARDADIADLNAELENAEDYAAAAETVDSLTSRVEAQPALETSLLEAAANKPVTPEVEQAVREMLGLD